MDSLWVWKGDHSVLWVPGINWSLKFNNMFQKFYPRHEEIRPDERLVVNGCEVTSAVDLAAIHLSSHTGCRLSACRAFCTDAASLKDLSLRVFIGLFWRLFYSLF